MDGPSAPSLRPLRGQLWELDLSSRKGREQRGVRPCLIVSTDGLNRSEFGTVVVCPITTRSRPSFLWRVGLQPSDLRIIEASWSPEPSWVQTDQIVTVDTQERVLRHLATILDPWKLDEVDDSLRLMLGL
ncbi:MAG: type II toxin-antitoxin system PemK/MazF family toxin [Gemmatimonadota bacterium]